jgi:hypothetical protein
MRMEEPTFLRGEVGCSSGLSRPGLATPRAASGSRVETSSMEARGCVCLWPGEKRGGGVLLTLFLLRARTLRFPWRSPCRARCSASRFCRSHHPQDRYLLSFHLSFFLCESSRWQLRAVPGITARPLPACSTMYGNSPATLTCYARVACEINGTLFLFAQHTQTQHLRGAARQSVTWR